MKKKKTKQYAKNKLDFKEVLKQMQKKEDVAFFGDCPKFKESSPDTINLDRAVQYLWLKEHNVDRREAIKFGMRRVCKIDCTRLRDGPSTARIMRPVKLEQGMVNGWQNGASGPQYELGDGYRTDFCQEAENADEKQFKQFSQYEKVEIEEKQKDIDYINRFWEELTEKYSFGRKNLKILHQKLLELREINKQRNETPMEFVEMKGLRFFHILSELEDYLDRKPDSKSILQELRTFQRFYQIDRKLKVQQLPLGEPMVPIEKVVEKPISKMKSIMLPGEQQLMLRKRAQTQLFSEKFNSDKQLFKVQQVPTMVQQQKINKFNQIMEQLKQNVLRTPKEADASPEHRKLEAIGKQKSRSNFITQLARTSTRMLNPLSERGSVTTTFRKRGSTMTTADSPTRRIFETKINRFVKQQVQSQNSSPTPLQVDSTRLRDLYKNLCETRRRELRRSISTQRTNVENPSLLSYLNNQ